MANDNVKIIINEVNETRPRGSGTSSDIAYIPGLAVDKWVTKYDASGNPVAYKQIYKLDDYGNTIKKTDENGNPIFDADGNYVYEMVDWTPSYNTPIYCSTVDEFESYFGPHPYEMTQSDVDITTYPHTYTVGDYDKSYIYAKELLNAGMSVIYENIASPKSLLVDLASVQDVTPYSEGQTTLSSGSSVNTFIFRTPEAPEVGEYKFSFQLPTDLGSSGSVFVQGILPSASSVLSLTIANIDCTNSKFVYDSYSNTLTWSNCTASEFASAMFEITLEYQYTGTTSGRLYNFAFHVYDADTYNLVNGDVAASSKIQYLYDKLPDCLDRIEDKSEYSVKYITSGGYPSFILVPQDNGPDTYVLADALIDCAAQRGDAVALVDHIDDPSCGLRYNDPSSFYYKANEYFNGGTNNEFGSMFTPWGRYTCTTVTDMNKMSQLMPASFGYLMCMASAIKTSPNWLAMAGVARGIVPNLKELHTDEILTNVVAEDYQPKYGKNLNNISVNAITNVRPYGLTIWGNRTLETVAEKGTTALNFLNTRNMVSDVKKLAYSTAKSLMFEQDSDTLWLRFKSGISPLLEQLKSGYGISNYKIIRGTTKYNGQALTRGEMAAVIKLYPLYAIEYFEITVVLADEDVTVS